MGIKPVLTKDFATENLHQVTFIMCGEMGNQNESHPCVRC